MTVYEKLIETVENGGFYHIDLNKKTLILNGKPVVINGKYQGDYGIDIENPKDTVEQLYEDFYHSVPSERSQECVSYFLAKKMDDMTDEELCTSKERWLCQAKLEGYVLGLILKNVPFSVFDENEKHYFWQSKNNSKLIIFKDWFTQPTED